MLFINKMAKISFIFYINFEYAFGFKDNSKAELLIYLGTNLESKYSH